MSMAALPGSATTRTGSRRGDGWCWAGSRCRGRSAAWSGHSDADVLTHAVIDALLGAAGLGDIGQHFPDTDEQWRDADSLDLLSQVCVFLEEHDYSGHAHRRHGDLRGAEARAAPRRDAHDARGDGGRLGPRR